MKRTVNYLLLLIGLALCGSDPISAAEGTVDVEVSEENDSVEEQGNGSMYLSSSDIEMISDGNVFVGLRFQNLVIPKDSFITIAYIQFTVDETNNSDGTLIIEGDDSGNAAQFDDTDNNVSGRPRTTSSTDWQLEDTNAWNTVGETQNSADISEIVEDIVARADWSSGNSMVFIISGTGNRVATSWEGTSLHVEWTDVAKPRISVDPENSLGVWSYEGLNADPGSFTLSNTGTGSLDYTITSDSSWFACTTNCSGTLADGDAVNVEITFTNHTLAIGSYSGVITIADDNDASNSMDDYDVLLAVRDVAVGSSCGEVPIYAENLVDPAILVLLDVSGSMKSMMALADSDSLKVSPDLTTLVQEVVNQGAWVSGNAMAFAISGTGKRVVESYDGMSSVAPNLDISYTHGGVTETVSVRINSSSDDAEEGVSDGSVSLGSSDLELIHESEDQYVGLRFVGVVIPQSATINSATISFAVDEPDPTETTDLVFSAELSENANTFTTTPYDISGRTWIDNASLLVSWHITEQWELSPEKARYVIGREVISELVEDRSISWGYGHWAFTDHPSPGGDPDISLLPGNPYGNRSNPLGLYTKIEAGVAHRNEAETTALKTEIESTVATSGTPLGPSMLAAWEYYRGNKSDEDGGYYDASLTCQPKFLIDITDGRGYPSHTEDAFVEPYTNLLGDAGISVIAVGFGLDDPRQVGIMARVANERGASDGNLYALHEVDENDVGQPFMAQNQEQLVTALQEITNSIKEQLFVGSSPAPSTSVDSGTFVINASFNAANWTGDLEARSYSPISGKFTMCVDSSGVKTIVQADIVGACIDPLDGSTSCAVADIVAGECLGWVATEEMPATKNAWTVDGADSESGGSVTSGVAGHYVPDHTSLGSYDIGLDGDNYICKDFGDIIKSTPVIVESPHKYYSFDNYRAYVFGSARTRDPMVYVGSNDGALHALNLATGIETWRFYPEKLHQRLKDNNICDGTYCHEYFVDGTPVAADIFKGTDADTSPGLGWRTMLLTGLGAGGNAFFALDITSANSFFETGAYTETDALTGATYLWQFSDDELGLTMAEPVIARTSSSMAAYGGWAAYFGSGYDENGSSSKESFLYGIEAYSMLDLWGSSTSYNRIELEENDRISYKSQLVEFAVGETVEGGTSGAQGTINTVVDNGISGTLVLSSITGMFSAEETLKVGAVAMATLDGSLHSAYYNDSLSDLLVADVDFNHVGDYLYVGNLYGRMYRLNNIAKGEDPTIDVLFDIHPAVVDHSTPIRAGASYGFDIIADTVWLYFGTGKFEEQIDKFNDEQQYFIGLQDTLVSPVQEATLTDLLGRQAVAVDATFNGVTREYRVITGHSYAYESTDTFSAGDVVTDPYTQDHLTITDIGTLNGEKIVTFAEADVVTNGTFVTGQILEDSSGNKMKIKGHPWYIALTRTAGNPSERVVAKSLIIGEVVFFTTFVPDVDVCGGNGAAWLYALNYETGLPAEVPVFDLDGDGDMNENDVVVEDGKRYYPAAIPIGRGIPSAPVLEGDLIFVNTTDSSRAGLPVNLPKLKAKMSSWKDSHF